MKITDVKIRKVFPEGKMKAVLSVTLDDVFAVHDIKVIEANGKVFVAMPSKKVGDDNSFEYKDICHPINEEFRGEFEAAVMRAYIEKRAELSESEG